MKKVSIKHPLAIRWFHWVNFPILFIMIWSGLLIYWANSVYYIGWGQTVLVKFFPQTFYDLLQMNYRLIDGMALHFLFMWVFSINGALYLLYLAFSGAWKHIWPQKNALRLAWQVLLHDIGFGKKTTETTKYNAAQQIAYTLVLVLGIGSVLSGLAIYKPIQLHWLCALMGGYKLARIIHFGLTIAFCLFFLVHVFQVCKAGWNNFQAMISGISIENKKTENNDGK